MHDPVYRGSCRHRDGPKVSSQLAKIFSHSEKTRLDATHYRESMPLASSTTSATRQQWDRFCPARADVSHHKTADERACYPSRSVVWRFVMSGSCIGQGEDSQLVNPWGSLFATRVLPPRCRRLSNSLTSAY